MQTVLNLACGGGKNAFNLKQHFSVTGVDLSEPMLDDARRQNPECTFVQADMRAYDLGTQFDGIFVDDGVCDLTSVADLADTFRMAFAHLRPGGAMTVYPGFTKETFRQNTTRVSYALHHLKPDHLDVVFITNEYDPDPTDDWYEYTFVFLIRENGQLRVETDRDTSGLFTMDTWRDTLRGAGFEVYEEPNCEEDSLTMFVCVKPQS